MSEKLIGETETAAGGLSIRQTTKEADMETLLVAVLLIGVAAWWIWMLIYLKRDYPIEERLQKYIRR